MTAEEKWTTIDTDIDNTELETIDEVVIEEEATKDDGDEVSVVEENDTKPVEKKAKKDESSSETEKRKSRAQERIRQLNAEKHKALEEARKVREELEAERKARAEEQEKALGTQLSSYDSELSSLKKELRQAVADGDVDAQIELQEKMNDIFLNRKLVEAKKARVETEKTAAAASSVKNTEKGATPAPDIPENVQHWVQKNAWVAQPRNRQEKLRQVAALDIARELEQEGVMPQDDEFLIELEKRLKQEFGGNDKNSVNYYSDDDSSSEEEDVKPVKKKASSSVVSGGARTPAASGTKISLTRGQAEAADRLFPHIKDPAERRKRYALRLKQKENAGDGWVNIF